MKARRDSRPIVSTLTDDEYGRRETITDMGVPSFGHGPFGVWLVSEYVHRNPSSIAALTGAGFVWLGKLRNPTIRHSDMWALNTPLLPMLCWWLLAERLAEWANTRLAIAAWNLGLIEPREAVMFSWRHDFAPFPWRGRRRERRR